MNVSIHIICMYTYINTHTHTCVRVCVCVKKQIYICVCVCMWVCVCGCAGVRVCGILQQHSRDYSDIRFQSCRGAVCPTEVTAQRRGLCDGTDMR